MPLPAARTLWRAVTGSSSRSHVAKAEPWWRTTSRTSVRLWLSGWRKAGCAYWRTPGRGRRLLATCPDSLRRSAHRCPRAYRPMTYRDQVTTRSAPANDALNHVAHLFVGVEKGRGAGLAPRTTPHRGTDATDHIGSASD